MTALKTEVFDKLFLHEYFLINIADHVKQLENFMKNKENIDPSTYLNKGFRDLIKAQLSFKISEIDLILRNMSGHGTKRYGVTVDIDFIACLLIDEDQKKPKSHIAKEFAWLLTQINS